MLNYWINLLKDIKIWYKFQKIAKENKKLLAKYNLRVDYLGRIYTVINLPEELQGGNEYIHETFVLQNLKPFTDVLLKIGIADYSYPEISKINEPGVYAYLVIIYPEFKALSLSKFIFNIFIIISIILLIKVLFKLFILYKITIFQILQKILNFIF